MVQSRRVKGVGSARTEGARRATGIRADAAAAFLDAVSQWHSKRIAYQPERRHLLVAANPQGVPHHDRQRPRRRVTNYAAVRGKMALRP